MAPPLSKEKMMKDNGAHPDMQNELSRMKYNKTLEGKSF